MHNNPLKIGRTQTIARNHMFAFSSHRLLHLWAWLTCYILGHLSTLGMVSTEGGCCILGRRTGVELVPASLSLLMHTAHSTLPSPSSRASSSRHGRQRKQQARAAAQEAGTSGGGRKQYARPVAAQVAGSSDGPHKCLCPRSPLIRG
jgi:hypothetical protein